MAVPEWDEGNGEEGEGEGDPGGGNEEVGRVEEAGRIDLEERDEDKDG